MCYNYMYFSHYYLTKLTLVTTYVHGITHVNNSRFIIRMLYSNSY